MDFDADGEFMIKTMIKKKRSKSFVMSKNELDSVIKFYIQNERRKRKRIIDENCRYSALCCKGVFILAVTYIVDAATFSVLNQLLVSLNVKIAELLTPHQKSHSMT